MYTGPNVIYGNNVTGLSGEAFHGMILLIHPEVVIIMLSQHQGYSLHNCPTSFFGSLVSDKPRHALCFIKELLVPENVRSIDQIKVDAHDNPVVF